VIAQRLEGSRFGPHPVAPANFVATLIRPKRLKTGGSRERLNVVQLYGPSVNESKASGKCIALGDSREPPVENSFRPDGALERISRGRLVRAKASPLQALGEFTG
jgi:hypothetical protein